MPRIPNVTTVRVSEIYKDSSGQALWGTVTFTPIIVPADRLIAPGSAVVLPSPVIVRVQNGVLNVDLMANDDPAVAPNGWAYEVVEEFSGRARNSYSLIITSALAPTVRLSSIVPLGTPPAPAATYVSAINGKSGQVAITKSDVGLSAVDNTQDSAKPVSTAQQTAIDGRATPIEAVSRNLSGLGLQAKGGSIGTGGKPVVSIRFDHHLTPLRTTLWPLLVARGIPASVGVVSRFPVGDTFSVGSTWADLRAMTRQGLEVWCHSATHGDAATQSALVDEIVTSKAEIEAQGFKVCGWQVAGVPGNTFPDWNLETNDHLALPAGRLVAQTYPFSEGYALGSAWRALPHRIYHGLNHLTIETLTLNAVKTQVQQAIASGAGIQLMAHPGYIGTAGYMTLADFTALLDWLVTKRDAEEIDILTATGLIAADPGHSRRLSLVGNPSFDPDYSLLWTGWNHSAGVSLRTTGGHTGSNFVQFTTLGTGTLQQATGAPLNTGTQGGTFRVEAWMRAPTAAATGKMRLVDLNNATRYDETRSFSISTLNVWQKVWWNTTLNPATTSVRLELSRDATVAQNIDMDDITITPV